MRKNPVTYVLIIFIGLAFSAYNIPQPTNPTLKTIIIDPGHGGKDVGARGRYSTEKDICLAVSMKLGERISKEFPDIKVLYTRTTDVYPELHERAKFANQNKGDLFVCIHVNSVDPIKERKLEGYQNVTKYTGKGASRKKITVKQPIYKTYTYPNPAKGTETYIWGVHKNDEKELALRENASLLLEDNYQAKYGDVDVNSAEFIVLSSLKTKQYFKRSATLALMVEEEFKNVGRVSREVKQRQVGIWVLQATAMPSILVETGFISNPEEEDYLNSEYGQNEIVQSIILALKRYKHQLEHPGQTENPQTGIKK